LIFSFSAFFSCFPDITKAEKEKIKLDINEKTNKYPDYVSYVNDEFTQLVSSSEGYDKRLEKASGKAKQKIVF
jgi:penicillin-binding protein 1A